MCNSLADTLVVYPSLSSTSHKGESFGKTMANLLVFFSADLRQIELPQCSFYTAEPLLVKLNVFNRHQKWIRPPFEMTD